MGATLRSLSKAIAASRKDGLSELARRTRNGWRSESLAYGLRRDLTKPHVPPDPKIPITVRPLVEDDIASLFDVSDISDRRSIEDRRNRLAFLHAGIGTAYVAVNSEDLPVYAQWIVSAEDNDRLRRSTGGLFPLLADDDVLLENAFMIEHYRGLRIMPAAMHAISETGIARGARWALTFVGVDNIPSLKGCVRAGFYPYVQRRDQWRGYRRRIGFEPLPPAVEI